MWWRELLPNLAWCVIALLVVGTYAFGPVSRERLERFARRQFLVVTVDNGNQVIRYLATTRRWRTAGFTAGALASVWSEPTSHAVLPVGAFVIFVGWLLGAVIAEARVARLAHQPVRSASLRPRRPDR